MRNVAAVFFLMNASLSMAADGAVLVDTDDVETFRLHLAPVAKHFNLRLLEVRPLDDDLESVFKYLVGR